jgi:hypothetical protein
VLTATICRRTRSLFAGSGGIDGRSAEQSGVADEAKSGTQQVDHAIEYTRRKGWTVDGAQLYVDYGISGAEFLKRPGFLRLMNARNLERAVREQVNLKFCGPWKESMSYQPRALVQKSAALWSATECNVGAAPGSDEGAGSWRLVVKSGVVRGGQ